MNMPLLPLLPYALEGVPNVAWLAVAGFAVPPYAPEYALLLLLVVLLFKPYPDDATEEKPPGPDTPNPKVAPGDGAGGAV